MDKINILGINISNLGRGQVLEKIENYLARGGQRQIVTPNAEIILEAIGHDEELFFILNKADLAVLDGSGPQLAALAIGHFIKRYPGADLLKDILALAEKRAKRVAVFNWRHGLSSAQEIRQALKKKYPKLEITVFEVERQAVLAKHLLAQAGDFKPDIIFSTLGAPRQEKFIYHNLRKLPSAKLGMGVGGAFDFLTGRIRRAPKILRIIGLEWLWRLIKQPWRIKRIYQAVIVFPCKFLAWRFVLPWLYRANVVGLLFKRENDKFKILIVERTDSPGHWQLPQGGTDGQSLAQAGERELREEINTDKFKSVAVFSNLHQYEFGDSTGKFMVLAKARGYKGQVQGLFIAEFLGDNKDIKVNFWEHTAWRWVEAEKLVESVHPVRRPSAKIFMEKFEESVISTVGRNL